MRKINLILDFDGVINNEPFATINAFKNVFRKINADILQKKLFCSSNTLMRITADLSIAR